MTLSTQSSDDGRRFTGRHMAIVMVGFFGTIIAVNLVMATLATRTFNGLVAKNGYVASIDFAQDTRNRKAAAALGWDVVVTGTPDGVTMQLVGPDGLLDASVKGTVNAVLGRGDTTPLNFAPDADGSYFAPVSLSRGDFVVRTQIADGTDSLAWRAVVRVE